MACKIVDSSTETRPVPWPSSPPSRSFATPLSILSPPPTQDDAPLQLRLTEIDRRKQVELSECRKVAFAEGLAKGRDESSAEIRGAAERLALHVTELVTLKRRIRNEAESELVKLSLAIAKRILHRELTADPDSILGVLHAGLQKLQNREIASVRVCPSAADLIRDALQRAGAPPTVKVVADPQMRIGDIVFETALGDLDASVETQLREIERGFADRLGLPC